MFEARCEQVPKEVAVEGEVEEQASLLHVHHAHGAITPRWRPPGAPGGSAGVVVWNRTWFRRVIKIKRNL